ncbi:interleukin-10 receptor subunit beta-like isoform X2 [Pseudophryne corroboree]
MDSVNFKNILRWNLSSGLGDDNVTYRVQYKQDVMNAKVTYTDVCFTSELYCDLTRVSYKSYLRVRMEVNDTAVSDWATIHFDPYTQTIIGPPEVKVSSRSGYLDVSIYGPSVESDGTLFMDKYYKFLYRIAYWKELEPAHVTVINTSQNIHILNKLDEWTTYCLKVQGYETEYDRAGQFSPVVCAKTTSDGRISTLKIVVVFVGALLITTAVTLVLSFVIFKVYRMIRYVFYPSFSFPQHLKEYLGKPFYSTPFLHTPPSEECGECSEQLTFVSEAKDDKEPTS